MKRIFLHILLLLMLSPAWAQLITDEARQRVRQGNDLYEAGKYVEAEVSYRKAEAAKANEVKGAFNLGNALYQQGRFQEAAGQFAKAANLTEDRQLQAEAYHNLGNAQLKAAMQPQSSPQGQPQQGNPLQQSIEAYKQALRRNPKDEETRYNLAYAMRQLQQQQQQQQNQNNDQNQQNQDQEQNQDQGDQDEQEQQKDQNQEQQGDREKQEQQADEQEQKPQQGREQEMSPEEIEQMLEALRYQEEKLRKDMQRQQTKGKQRKVEKDW